MTLRNYTLIKFFICIALFFTGKVAAQINKNAKPEKMDEFNLPFVFDKDSLKGFDEGNALIYAKQLTDETIKQARSIARQKRDFIDFKYGFKNYPSQNSPTGSNAKPIGGGNNTVMAACTNVDFEAGNISGWTLTQGANGGSNAMVGCCPAASTQFAVVSAGTDPNTGIQMVPPGAGNFTCRFGNMTAGGNSYRLKQTFNVTAANSVFIFRYAVILEDGSHICNEQPFFNVTMVDCSNNPIPCSSFNVVAGTGCQGFTNFQTSGTYKYKNWQTNAFDLTQYIGSCVTIEFTVGGCVSWQGAHAGYAYVDASCLPMNLTLNNVVIPTSQTTTSLCLSGNNVLCAPLGFNYLWTGPSVTGSTAQCVNVNSTGNYSVALSQTGQNCFSPTLTSNFVYIASPIADFNISNIPCTNTVSCTSTSSLNNGPPITGYTYTWNDATPNASVNPATHVYTSSGPKQIKLVITSAAGCKDSITKSVNISQKPAANFTFNPACSGAAINFTNTSTTPVGSNNSTWDFGDASGSPATSPSHNYSTSGNYSVTLVVTNTDNCKDSIKKQVNVYGRAVVNFTPTGVCFGTVSNFTNLTTTTVNANTGAIATSSWSFGDGGTSAVTNPAYTYTSPANATTNTNYNAWLYVTTVNGCKDSLMKQVTVYSLPTPNFTADSVCLNNATTLTNTSSNNGNPFFQFKWDINNDNIADMTTTSNFTTFVFPNIGNNSVTFTVLTSPNGGVLQCKNSVTKNVFVRAIPQAIITNTNQCVNAAIGLSGVTSTIGNGTITNYAWNYGNSNSSLTNATPSTSVNYATSGIYLVTLTVTGTGGCPGVATKTVSVYGRAAVNFTASSVCFGSVTGFTNNTSTTANPNTSGISTYIWNFGSGGTSTSQNPSYTYTTPANATANTIYTVNLYATTTDGCKDSIAKQLTVYSLPTASFVADSVCMGSGTSLSDFSNGNGNPFFLFSWDFNGDNVADLTNNSISTVHTFTNWGNNSVTYTVYTSPNAGLLTCRNGITKNVWVHPSPVAAISYTNKCVNAQPNAMNAGGSTLAVGTITNYAWDYGNGNTNLNNLTAATSYSYNTPGSYVITLTVTSGGGCRNVTTQITTVFEMPFANFTYSKACAGKLMTLKATQSPVSGPISSFQWDLNNNTTNIEATGGQVTYTFNTAGTQPVNLLLTTSQGCTNTIPGNIYINYNPKANFYAPKRAGCTDLCIQLFDSTQAITGPAKNETWEWDFGNQLSNTVHSSSTQYVCYTNSSNLLFKDYNVKLIVRTDSGCVDSLRKNKYIRVYPKPKANFEWTGKDGDLLTPFISFENTSVGYNRFAWYYNDGVNITDSANQHPTHYYNTDIPRKFQVFLAVRNQYGCKDTITKYVEIGPEYTFYIPNTFTPNGDGNNEVFTGTGIGIQGFKMWIYDRWGEMLYYTEDIMKGWDASVKGKKDKEKVDVYTYKCIVTDLWHKQHEYVGHVTLLK